MTGNRAIDRTQSSDFQTKAMLHNHAKLGTLVLQNKIKKHMDTEQYLEWQPYPMTETLGCVARAPQ